MKISNLGHDKGYTVAIGAVASTSATASGLPTTIDNYLNNSGIALIAGDVVVLDTTADKAITTTTTAQDTRPVGIVQDDIAIAGTGPILWQGYAALVNTTASVTRGYYAETSTTVKQATQNATRRAGSFAVYLTGGTTPTAYLFGIADGASAALTGFGTPAILYGAPAAGAATTAVRTDATITPPTEAQVTFTNITTNNVSASKHGYAPILPNDAGKYLNGTGAYSAPPGTTDHQHINAIEYNGDGARVAFELPAAPYDAYAVIASVAGVIQDVTLSGAMLTTMTFASAPAVGTNNVRVDIVAAVL